MGQIPLSQIVDRVAAGAPAPAAGSASAGPTSLLQKALPFVGKVILYGGLAWVGSKIAEEGWSTIGGKKSKPARKPGRRLPKPITLTDDGPDDDEDEPEEDEEEDEDDAEDDDAADDEE